MIVDAYLVVWLRFVKCFVYCGWFVARLVIVSVSSSGNVTLSR